MRRRQTHNARRVPAAARDDGTQRRVNYSGKPSRAALRLRAEPPIGARGTMPQLALCVATLRPSLEPTS